MISLSEAHFISHGRKSRKQGVNFFHSGRRFRENRAWKSTKYTWVQLTLDLKEENISRRVEERQVENIWNENFFYMTLPRFRENRVCKVITKAIFNETHSKSIFLKMKLQTKTCYSTVLTCFHTWSEQLLNVLPFHTFYN